MKILLKAQACFLLPLSLGFTLHLFLSPPTPHFVPSLTGWRVKAVISRAGSGGVETTLALGHLWSCSLPEQADPTRACWAPCRPGIGSGEGPCVHSHQAGVAWPWPSASYCLSPLLSSPPSPPQAMLILYKPARGTCPASHGPGPSATWHSTVSAPWD